jgi:hypothetical protein
MGGGFLASMKRWILWDYPRGSLQYDLMVALILAFIFLTPRAIFRDHPKPKEVVLVPAEGRGAAFWIEPELLDGVPEGGRLGRVDELVRRQGKTRNLRVTRVEPIFDAEQEVRGYMAFADAAE